MKIKDFKKVFGCIGVMNNLNVIIYNNNTCEVIKEYKNYWDFNYDHFNEDYKICKIGGIILFEDSLDLWVE